MKKLLALLGVITISLSACTKPVVQTPILPINKNVSTLSTTKTTDSTIKLPQKIEKIHELFKTYIGTISAEDLEKGDCVARADEFYKKIQSANLDVTNARIILFVREPNTQYGMSAPQPLKPNNDFIKGQVVPFWIWHSFVIVDGYVFDPKYKLSVDTIDSYYKNLWEKNDAGDSWIFSIKPETLPQITGSPYPGAKPRMFNFVPISFKDLVKNPLHLTVKK